MGILIQPKRWTVQPPVGTQINWGHPLAQGLVGCWLFNEGSGLRLNDGLLRTNGTLTGTPKPTWTTSPNGTALSFSAGTSYVDLPSAANLVGLTGPMSEVILINPSTPSALGVITSNSTANVRVLDIEIARVAGKLNALQGSTILGSSNTILTAGKWYHFAVVRTGSSGSWTVTYYLNGIADGAVTTSTNPSSTLSSQAFGAVTGGSVGFVGSIASVAFWNRPLSASEAQWLYIAPYAFMQPQSRIFCPPGRVADEGYVFHYHR